MLNYSKKNGGAMFEAQSDSVLYILFAYGRGRIDWIRDILFHSAETLLVDDLSSLAICLIGTLAHVDAPFRAHLKEKIARCRSRLLSGRTAFADYLFETTFGPASVESHFRILRDSEKFCFLRLVCGQGSSPMMKILLDIGVNVDTNYEFHNSNYLDLNLLGNAAAEGNMDVIHTLLEAGANGSLAIKTFLGSDKPFSDDEFRRILRLLVENSRPGAIYNVNDPVSALIGSSRALYCYPVALKILLDRKVFVEECFGKGTSKSWSEYSYMYQAISRGNPSVVDLLLQNGAHANAQISDSFRYSITSFKSCTWITFSIMCGAAPCTAVLIQHGADVTTLDGAGRSPLRLAKDFALGSHPRKFGSFYRFFQDEWKCVTAQDDAETLAVVERAFIDKFQGMKTLEDYYDLNEDFAPQHPPPQDEPASIVQRTFNKALTAVLTPAQIKLLHRRLRYSCDEIQIIWSLSFYEALFIRLIYVLSYALLLTIELHALIKSHKRVQMPSRYFLSALAVLALALMWCSSLLGYS